MSPKTDRIVERYNDGAQRAHEMHHHAQRMEDGLISAVRELERVNNTEAGRPLVSHNLLYNLRNLLT